MKIAHVVCSFPPYRGGIGNSALQMAKSVLAYGHSVTVMTPDYGQDRRRDAEPELGALTH
jgi:glycogen synthase